jgi:hypothetical protein
MSNLDQERTAFIELLHDVFIKQTGHGAFATISIADTMSLFEKYLVSDESAGRFINHFVRSV